MVLRVFSLVYNVFRIPIETEDVVKSILMLPDASMIFRSRVSKGALGIVG